MAGGRVFEDQDSKFGGVPHMDQDRDDIGQFEGLIQSYSGLSLSKPTPIFTMHLRD